MPTATMQIFLPGICSIKKDRYHIPHIKDEETSKYLGTHAHKLDSVEVESSEMKSLDKQEDVNLDIGAPFPFCEAEGWVKCESLEILHCVGSLMQIKKISENMETICPSCKVRLTLAFGDDKLEADFSRG